MKTITIIGGGLAGLSLGNALLRKGVPVILHEKKLYPTHRVCGEFISGVSEETLEKLNLTQFLSSAQSVPSVSWHIADRKILDTSFDAPAYGISRYTLDYLLAEEFENLGGELHTESKFKDAPAEGQVWASGKPMNQGGNWIGLSIHLSGTGVDHLEMHSGPSGYIGLSPIENQQTNVTGLFKKDSNINGKGLELITHYLRANDLQALADRLAQCEAVRGSFCAISGFEFGNQSSNTALSIGDAAQLVPPFVGNGMSMALESSAIAADIITEYADQQISWEECSSRIDSACAKLFSTRMKVAMHFHPILLSKLGLKTISATSKLHLLPVKTLYKLTR